MEKWAIMAGIKTHMGYSQEAYGAVCVILTRALEIASRRCFVKVGSEWEGIKSWSLAGTQIAVMNYHLRGHLGGDSNRRIGVVRPFGLISLLNTKLTTIHMFQCLLVHTFFFFVWFIHYSYATYRGHDEGTYIQSGFCPQSAQWQHNANAPLPSAQA